MIGTFLNDPEAIDHKKIAPLEFEGNWAAYTESIRRKVQKSKYKLLQKNYDIALRKKQSMPPERQKDHKLIPKLNPARNKSHDKKVFETKKTRSSISLNTTTQQPEKAQQLTTHLNEFTPQYQDLLKNS